MQQFGNLKVGSVFSFLHPKTAVSVFKFFFFFFGKLKNETAVSVFGFGFESENRAFVLTTT